MKKIGFHKSVQGVFTPEYITQLKAMIIERLDCELVEVDFRDGVIIGDKVYVGEICLNDLDVYFWHDTVRPRDWGADNYFCHILETIAKDVAVINTGASVRITNDKFLAHRELRHAGLPVGDFALVRGDDIDGLRKVFDSFGGDVLLKPRFGGWGIGIVRLHSFDELQSTIDFAQSFSSGVGQFLVERYYPNDLSQWISVVVFDDKVLFGYRKPLLTDDVDWKIYDPLKQDGRGQKTVPVEVPTALATVALDAAAAIGKDIIGFDFIATNEGYKIIDENGRPGLYKHCLEFAQVDLIEELVTLIAKKL